MSGTGVSLNDTLQVGPTVHSSLLDVLIRFRNHRIAITADVTKMYRAVGLTEEDKDFHRFLWRSDPNETVVDWVLFLVTTSTLPSLQAYAELHALSPLRGSISPCRSTKVKVH